MLKFLKLIYGYVIILVRGENLERFLNLCKSRKVYMEKIRYREDGQLMAQMQAADFFRLRPLRNKTGVHIQIIQRRGMPFFFLRNKKERLFYRHDSGRYPDIFLTGRIWNIHIEGNVRNSTGEILDFLDKQDINHGMSKKRSTVQKLQQLYGKIFRRLPGYLPE